MLLVTVVCNIGSQAHPLTNQKALALLPSSKWDGWCYTYTLLYSYHSSWLLSAPSRRLSIAEFEWSEELNPKAGSLHFILDTDRDSLALLKARLLNAKAFKQLRITLYFIKHMMSHHYFIPNATNGTVAVHMYHALCL